MDSGPSSLLDALATVFSWTNRGTCSSPTVLFYAPRYHPSTAPWFGGYSTPSPFFRFVVPIGQVFRPRDGFLGGKRRACLSLATFLLILNWRRLHSIFTQFHWFTGPFRQPRTSRNRRIPGCQLARGNPHQSDGSWFMLANGLYPAVTMSDRLSPGQGNVLFPRRVAIPSRPWTCVTKHRVPSALQWTSRTCKCGNASSWR